MCHREIRWSDGLSVGRSLLELALRIWAPWILHEYLLLAGLHGSNGLDWALNGHSQAGNWRRQKRWSGLPFSHPVPKTLGAVSVSLWNSWLGWPAPLSRRNFTVGPAQPMPLLADALPAQRRDVDALIERVVSRHLQPSVLQFLCEELAHAQALGARRCRLSSQSSGKKLAGVVQGSI